MAIQFVSGKPGGGKSLFGVMLVIDELRLGRRMIVTNLSLSIPNLCHYLHETYGETFDATNRIYVLDESECFNFWLYRGQGRKVEGRRKIEIQDGERKGDKIEVPDFLAMADRLGSVLYVVDECHKFFSARNWAANGKDGFYYLSEHRKFGDDVILVTQAIDNVDKQMRGIAQDFTYLRNFYKEKVGRFRSFQFFQRKTYGAPCNGKDGQIAFETVRFKLDVAGICSCYDTAAGVGIVGRSGADKGKHAKGVPIKYFFVALAACVVVVIASVAYFSTHGGKFIAAVMPSPAQAAEEYRKREIAAGHIQTNAPGAKVYHADPRGTNFDSAEKIPIGSSGSVSASMVGKSKINGIWFVFLSDGRELRSDDALFEWLTEKAVRYDGHTYEKAIQARSVRDSVAGYTKSIAGEFLPSAVSAAHEITVPKPEPLRTLTMPRTASVHWSDGSTTQHQLSAAQPAANEN